MFGRKYSYTKNKNKILNFKIPGGKKSNSEVRTPITRETSNQHAPAGGTSLKLG